MSDTLPSADSDRLSALLADAVAETDRLRSLLRDARNDAADALARAERSERHHTEDIETISDHMLQAAEDNSFCEVYDETVDEMNDRLHIPVRRRMRDWSVWVDVSVQVPVMVSAATEDEAKREAAETWRDRFREVDGDAWTVLTEATTSDDWSEFSAEVSE